MLRDFLRVGGFLVLRKICDYTVNSSKARDLSKSLCEKLVLKSRSTNSSKSDISYERKGEDGGAFEQSLELLTTPTVWIR